MKKQTVYIGLNTVVLHNLNRKHGIYSDKWLYGDMLAVACHDQRALAVSESSLYADSSNNIISLVNVLSNEMCALSKFRCEYCDGFGHIGTDYITVKLGKRTRVPSDAKRNVYGSSEYITFNDRCPTKNNLE